MALEAYSARQAGKGRLIRFARFEGSYHAAKSWFNGTRGALYHDDLKSAIDDRGVTPPRFPDDEYEIHKAVSNQLQHQPAHGLKTLPIP